MNSPDPTVAQYLLERIRDVRETLGSEDDWSSQDVRDLVLEAAEYVCGALHLKRLEIDLANQAEVDTDALERATTLLESATNTAEPTTLVVRFADGTTYDWQERLASLRAIVPTLEASRQLDELEVGLRLAMVIDPAMAGLLGALAPSTSADPVREQLRQATRQKLGLLGDDDAMEAWATFRAEVDPALESHLPLDESVVDRAFFDFPRNPDDARDRIARYLAEVRPALKRAAIAKGQTSFVAAGFGIGTVLSWTVAAVARGLTMTERVAVRAVGRLCHAWRGEAEELARALGVERDGYFVGGRAQEEAKRTLQGPRGSDVNVSDGRILDELTKLVRIAGHHAPAQDAPVERALVAHKLGLEVVAPDIRDELQALDELALQRRLCRFLFERDIRAYGTKIGWSELDVRAEDGFASLLIEAKKVVDPVTATAVNKWLTQLGSYLDQEHRALRGALVLYNFTDVPIFTPKHAVLRKYLLVAVNLCAKSPSKRTAHIEVMEGTHESEPVRVHQVGARAKAGLARE